MAQGERHRPWTSRPPQSEQDSGPFVVGAGLALAERPDPSSELVVYRQFLGGLDYGFCILEAIAADGAPVDLRIVEANEAFEQLMKLSGPAGRLLSEVAPEVLADWLTPLARVSDTGTSERFEEVAYAGRICDVYAQSVGGPEDRFIAVLLVDITQAKAGKDELGHAIQVLNAHLQNSPLAVVEFDPDFRVIGWSDEAERVFGYHSDEILGRAISEIRWVYEDDQPLVEQETAGFIAGTRTRSKNVNRNYRKDGSVIWCEWYSSAIYDDAGHLQSVLSLVLDVTKRIQAEEARARQLESMALLKELAEVGATSLDETVTAKRLVDALERGLRARTVALLVADRKREVLRPLAFVGYSNDEVERIFGSLTIDGPSAGAGVFRSRRAIFVEDSEADSSLSPESKSFNRSVGVRAMASLPVVVSGRSIGMLSMGWPEPRSFDSDEVSAIQSVASQVALAVRNARLYEDEIVATEQARRELERTSLLLEASTTLADWRSLPEVAGALAVLLIRTTDHTRATVGEYDERADELHVLASRGRNPASSGDRWPVSEASHALRTALDTRKPVECDFDELPIEERGVIANAYHFRRALYVPLVRHSRVIGMVIVDDPDEPREFTERDRALIEGIGSHAAASIQNARLLVREREAAKFGDILASIDRSVHSSLKVEDIVASALAEGAAAIGADSASVAGIEDGGWAVWYAWGFRDPIVGAQFTDAENGHGVAAVREGETVAIDDVSRDARVDCEIASAYGLRSVIVAPLVVRGQPIAVLYYNYTREVHRFTEAEIDFVGKVASSLSLAIENARHYETEHRISETLQETLVVLPTHVEGIAFSRAYESATYEAGRVGGDFVDVFELHKNTVGIALGDVSGKGVDAAVTTSLVRTTLRVHAIDGLPPAALATKTNEVLRAFTQTESFITVWFGLLNTKTGHLRYVCAGHPPAIVLAASGEPRELQCADPILGAFDDAKFYECQTVLTPGDRLVLYSDGLTEARGPDGEFLDYEGVLNILRRRSDRPTTELANDIMDEVVEFSDGILRDDAAVLVVEPVRLADPEDSGQLHVDFCEEES